MEYSNHPEGSGMPEEVTQPDLHADEDGRNREWEDRARVNLENVPEGVHTSIERDFEPEQDAGAAKKERDEHPAY